MDASLPAVEKHARSSRHEAAVAAGEVLAALALAVEALPDPHGVAREKMAEIRFESERLRRSEPLSFGIAKWIKLGLAAALDALEMLTPTDDAKTFWVSQARHSNEAIDAGASATFQRAALQDALRTTITAFVVVRRGPAPCR